MKHLLQEIIQAQTENSIHNTFEEYISHIPGITMIQVQELYTYNIDKNQFSEPYLYAIKVLEDNKKIGFISVKVNGSLSEKTGKKAQYDLAKNLIRENQQQFEYGIFLFYDSNFNFRFSFIYNYIQDDKRKYNNFKRYTYFVDREQSNKTFLDRISQLNYINLAEIIEAFSVEKVNEAFYKEIATWFHKFVGAKTAKAQYDTAFKLPSTDPITGHKIYQDFAVRLIGRLVFVWFLKFKKDNQGKGLIPDELISTKAVQNYTDYYHQILEKVFFEMLNKKIRSRDDNALGQCLKYSQQIPYLNGGLFEAINQDYYELDNFSGYSLHQNNLIIDNSLFEDIFQILERYNFTIDENSTTDVEVSVDPEMLGRIFENLLGEINPETGDTARKSTGSFYTPRSIVEYMVRQTIIQYLADKTSINKEILDDLCFENFDKESNISPENKIAIINALDTLKILDPACGSGAYPMGILQQIFIILQKIDPDNSLWLELMTAKLPNETLRNELRSNPAIDYIRKLGIIETSIFGVDIQESAVEISRLRFFLSLIVDQEIQENKENRGIEALPNLDFKFVSANTLLSLDNNTRQGKLSDPEIEVLIAKLKSLRARFFNEHTEKESLKTQFVSIQKQLTKKYDKLFSSIMSKKIADWEPFIHQATDWFDPEWMFGVTEGFDIVIGNPPYIQLQNKKLIPEYISKAYKSEGYLTFKSTGDIYALFYERGFDLLRKDGILCYITSNKWMRAGYGEALRGYFADHTIPLQLIDFGGFKVFKSATVDTNIYLAKKGTPQEYQLQAIHFKNDFKEGDNLTEYITKNSLNIDKLSKDTWFIGSKAEIALKEKIEKLGKPLKNWDVNIYRGVLTGLNEAFIIDEETRTRLIKEDPKSEEIIKLILRGRDIKRYGYEESGLYLITTHNGYKGVPSIQIDGYPAIKNHLNQYEPKLSKRGDKGKTKYNLRDCAYMGEFEKEKVVYSEIVREPRFYFDKGELYCEATTFLITGNNIKYICGLLNSNFVTYIFKKYYAGGGLGETGYRYKKIFLEKIPIPKISETNENMVNKIQTLVDQILEAKKYNKDGDTIHLEAEIDELVMDLYQLTPEEREIVK
jgi:adenine-specific DNA-methyltransferase